jgi:predicted TIM-barrel fold metal-dependent hydrolase
MIIDVNVSLARWPFRRLVGDETPDLVARLRERKVVQAWAGSFDGILHKDIGGVNGRLAAECRSHGEDFLVPFGSVNPKLPDWQEDLRRCQEDYRMLGIRLHPNYHGYDLRDPAFVELIKLAAERRLIVQIAVCMEDERTQHPLLRVPPVDCTALPELLKHAPALRLVLINCLPAVREKQLQPVLAAGDAYCDLSMVEGIEGVGQLVERVSPKRVLFGSNFPLFYFESALLKIQESGLPESEKNALMEGNARQLLASVGRTST